MPQKLALILDVQHDGRPSKPGDMGAAHDLNGNGVVGETGEREVDIVRGYTGALAALAQAQGIPCHILTTGEYNTRHLTAIGRARAAPEYRHAYLACHVNAGRGRYGLVRADYRSVGGKQLAEALAEPLRGLLGGARTDPLYPTPLAAKGAGRDVGTHEKHAWWTRGWSCIDGIYAGPSNLSGVLLEPAFIDQPGHKPYLVASGWPILAEVLLRGLTAWAAA